MDEVLPVLKNEIHLASGETFRAVFEYAAIGMGLADTDGKICYANPAFLRITGYEPELLYQQDLLAVTYPDDRARSIESLERLLAGDIPNFHIEKRMLRSTGEAIWVRNSVSLLEGKNKDCYILVLAEDISDRKKAELALQQANEFLEKRVAERTAELERAFAERRALMAQVVRAQEEERRSISHELHDQMGQHLTAFSLALKALEPNCDPDSEAPAQLAQLRRITERLAQDVHRIAVRLRPTALDDLGLLLALQAHVEEWQKHSGIVARLQVVGDLDIGGAKEAARKRLSRSIETAAYRVVQEALTNVARHATGATLVTILIQQRDDWLLVTIEDNGKGFDVEAAIRSGRLGLVGMRERTLEAGGTLEIESEPSAGTTVFLRLPLQIASY